MAAPAAQANQPTKPGYPVRPGYPTQPGYPTHVANPTIIHLSAPTRVYQPGDTITGTLLLPKDRPDSPTLVLQGLVKTKINGSRSRTLVVWQPMTIQELKSMPATESILKTYSFSTTIPLDCSRVSAPVPSPNGKAKDYWVYPSTWKKDTSGLNRFTDKESADVPLPPTCKFHSERTRPKIITDCHVEYAIVALNVKKEGASLVTMAPFWLISLSEQLPQDRSLFVLHADKRLLFYGPQLMPEPENVAKPTGLRRILSGSKSSPKPEAAFLVKVTRPKFMRAGSTIGFLVELEPSDTEAARYARNSGRKAPDVLPVEMPSIKLIEAKVWIQQTTDMRARGSAEELSEGTLLMLTEPPKPKTKTSNAEDQHIVEISHWPAEDLLASLGPDGACPAWLKGDKPRIQTPNNDANQNRKKVELQIPLPSRLAPTFKSYNLARRYKWMLKLSFSCAGQIQHTFYQFPGVVILPPQVNGVGQADDDLAWGPYKLESEDQVMKDWIVELGSLAWDVANFAINVASLF